MEFLVLLVGRTVLMQLRRTGGVATIGVDLKPEAHAMFGEVLFSGSKFIRWSLAPWLVVFIVAVPLLIPEWTAVRAALVVFVEACAVLFLLGLLAPRRCRWAFRGVTALVFLAYLFYLGDMLFRVLAGLPMPKRKGVLLEATLGFIIIGLPCLWYTLFGHFGSGEYVPEETDEDELLVGEPFDEQQDLDEQLDWGHRVTTPPTERGSSEE
jgi:hypothetical protein